jgi:hypothetical protein
MKIVPRASPLILPKAMNATSHIDIDMRVKINLAPSSLSASTTQQRRQSRGGGHPDRIGYHSSLQSLVCTLCLALLMTGRAKEAAVLSAAVLQRYDIAADCMILHAFAHEEVIERLSSLQPLIVVQTDSVSASGDNIDTHMPSTVSPVTGDPLTRKASKSSAEIESPEIFPQGLSHHDLELVRRKCAARVFAFFSRYGDTGSVEGPLMYTDADVYLRTQRDVLESEIGRVCSRRTADSQRRKSGTSKQRNRRDSTGSCSSRRRKPGDVGENEDSDDSDSSLEDVGAHENRHESSPPGTVPGVVSGGVHSGNVRTVLDDITALSFRSA